MDKYEELKKLMKAKFNEINDKLLEMQNRINLLQVKFNIMFSGKEEIKEKNSGWDQERIERLHREIDFII